MQRNGNTVYCWDSLVAHLVTASIVAQMAKKNTCSTGNLGKIPGLGRFPGEGNSYPLQYSGLENSMDNSMGSERVWTRLSDFHFQLVNNLPIAQEMLV